jgi:hypothetical protein
MDQKVQSIRKLKRSNLRLYVLKKVIVLKELQIQQQIIEEKLTAIMSRDIEQTLTIVSSIESDPDKENCVVNNSPQQDQQGRKRKLNTIENEAKRFKKN